MDIIPASTKPLVAVLCHGSVMHGRPSQYATEQFLRPVASAGGSTFLVPALADVVDTRSIAERCDALLLTGSFTNVSPKRYGADHEEPDANPDRDQVAMELAGHMIGLRKPVLGICLGMQELAVLYGGTLRSLGNHGLHMADMDWRDPDVFLHHHRVTLLTERMERMAGATTVEVTSVHRQGVDRLGSGLTVEAISEDGLVEAFRGDDEGRVTGVQWHPERARSPLDDSLFRNLVELS